MADLTGDQSTYGVIGIDLNIRDANQVRKSTLINHTSQL